MSKLTTEQLIEKFRKTHDDLYDYSLVEYTGQNNKVKIICKVHGMFEQRPGHHANGSGCQTCYNKKRGLSKKLTTEMFVQKCVEKFGNKYDYSQTVYLGNAKKITVVCKEHGPFEVLANDHLSKGTGCKKCNGRMINTLDEFIEFCTNIHGGKYDYNKVVYKNTSTKVEIVCPVHGSFWQTPHGHRMGFGCDMCSGTYSLTTEEFIARSKAKFGNKFSYEKTVYARFHDKVVITCRENGDFEVTPAHHLNSSTGYSTKIANKPRPLSYFLTKSEESHGGRYKYGNVEYVNRKTKVKISCPVHGDFMQKPVHHWNGAGCPKCNTTFNTEALGFLYVLKIGDKIGFGVTNNFTNRLSTHKSNLGRSGFTVEIIHVFEGLGNEVLSCEREIKNSVEIVNLGVEGFKTEATTFDNLPKLLATVKSFNLTLT